VAFGISVAKAGEARGDKLGGKELNY